MPCQIEISETQLMLHIGCQEAERAQAQPIGVRVVVRNREFFLASQTDRLSDTLDVEAVRATLAKQFASTQVQTLEKLGQMLENALRERFNLSGLNWEITLTKPRYGWSYVHAWSS